MEAPERRSPGLPPLSLRLGRGRLLPCVPQGGRPLRAPHEGRPLRAPHEGSAFGHCSRSPSRPGPVHGYRLAMVPAQHTGAGCSAPLTDLMARYPLLHRPDRWEWAAITMTFTTQLPPDHLVASTHVVGSSTTRSCCAATSAPMCGSSPARPGNPASPLTTPWPANSAKRPAPN